MTEHQSVGLYELAFPLEFSAVATWRGFFGRWPTG